MVTIHGPFPTDREPSAQTRIRRCFAAPLSGKMSFRFAGKEIIMLQDILPHVYYNEYKDKKPKDTDVLVLQKGSQVLLRATSFSGNSSSSIPSPADRFELPTVAQIRSRFPQVAENAFYLFSIDNQGYFTASDTDTVREGDGFFWQRVLALREMQHDYHSFGGAVGWQLASWYDLHRFCGRCGCATIHASEERAIVCPKCGHSYYPRISPVVIIAIVDGDRILLTRYQGAGYRRHALVAGFVEIGETLEDAVRREVMEEVGLKVKNIQYIESQPWPFSSSLIAGFRAEVDGDPTVRLNADGKEELSEAVWTDRKDLKIEDSSVSLTWDMIRKFMERSGGFA